MRMSKAMKDLLLRLMQMTSFEGPILLTLIMKGPDEG